MMQSDGFHGGWIGGMIGVTLTMGFVVLRDRRRNRAGQVQTTAYEYDENDMLALRETEMT
jgi:hypothetical protein